MKTYSDTHPEVYAVSGSELRIHWNLREAPSPGMSGESRTQWEANEAVCSVNDDRGTLISKIIRSVFTVDDEIALINNQTTEPDEYAAYQAFRTEAKALADGWLVSEPVLVIAPLE